MKRAYAYVTYAMNHQSQQDQIERNYICVIRSSLKRAMSMSMACLT